MMQDRGFSYTDPLGKGVDVPPAGLPPERLTELTIKIREGRESRSERDEVAMSYIRLAIAVASQYAAHNPNKADDLLQCALFGIIKGLAEAQEKMYDDDLTPYLAAKMHSMCKNFRQKDHVFRVPATTNSRRKKNGKEQYLFNRRGMFFLEDRWSAEGDDRVVKRGEYDDTFDALLLTEDRSEELEEYIYSLAADDIDREIIELRLSGYNDGDIAGRMGVSRSYIQSRRAVIQQKFEREMV